MSVLPCNSGVGKRAGAVFVSLILAVGCFSGAAAPASAQTASKTGRKLVTTVKPEYPETLRIAQIGGLVRLSATVQPNGSVSQVEIRGGNPILAEKAQLAVMKWKYAPAPTQTTEEISLSFSPH